METFQEEIPDDGRRLWNRNTAKIILLTILTAALIVLAVLGIKRLIPGPGDIRAGISKPSLHLNESLAYKDSSAFAKKWRWTFGDGAQSFTSAGLHHYNAPGNYTVRLTVNEQLTDSFFVTVNDSVRIIPLADSVARIDAPVTAFQFENVTFRASASGAAQYRWKFGESGSIDSKEPFVEYFYNDPGNYTVLLYTDNNQYPVRHAITILPAYQAKTDTVNIDEIYKKQEGDFKIHLQQIADGAPFNIHYYYLLRKYLCGNEHLPIKINGQKVNDYNSYCLGLVFDKGVSIQSVKLSPDEDLKCIRAVEVKQVEAH